MIWAKILPMELQRIVRDNTGTGWGIKAGTVYMAFATGVSALLMIGFQMMAVRLLKPAQYGSVSVLYAAVLILFPFTGQTFELAMARYIPKHEANGEDSLAVMRKILFCQASTMFCLVGIALLFRDLITENLFPESPSFFGILLLSTVVLGFELGIRGILRGLREFGSYGTLGIVLNFARIAFLLIFVNVMNLGLTGAGLSILLAPLASLLLWPVWYPRIRARLKGKSPVTPVTIRNLLKFLAPIMPIWGCAAFFYSIGPVWIKSLGGVSANELAGLFLIATLVTRLPLQLSQALFANLLPNMSRLSAQDDWRKIKYYITKSYMIFVPLLLAAIVGTYLLGPLAISLFYPAFSYSRQGLTLLMVGTAAVVLAGTETQFLLSRSKGSSVLVAWLLGCLVLTGVVLLGSWSILFRLELGYVLGGLLIWFFQAGSARRVLRGMARVHR
ncbi:lipopolysaccharide biosynthesis protein [Chloroflexota bacterium]